MLRTALVVDNTNLYYSLRHAFGPRKLIYERYLKAIPDCHTLLFKVLYASQDSVPDFETSLQRQGFETHFASVDWTVPMTLRIADIIDKVDCIIIGSNNDNAADHAMVSEQRQDRQVLCLQCSDLFQELR